MMILEWNRSELATCPSPSKDFFASYSESDVLDRSDMLDFACPTFSPISKRQPISWDAN
jgi:hypothetical protein